MDYAFFFCGAKRYSIIHSFETSLLPPFCACDDLTDTMAFFGSVNTCPEDRKCLTDRLRSEQQRWEIVSDNHPLLSQDNGNQPYLPITASHGIVLLHFNKSN